MTTGCTRKTPPQGFLRIYKLLTVLLTQNTSSKLHTLMTMCKCQYNSLAANNDVLNPVRFRTGGVRHRLPNTDDHGHDEQRKHHIIIFAQCKTLLAIIFGFKESIGERFYTIRHVKFGIPI